MKQHGTTVERGLWELGARGLALAAALAVLIWLGGDSRLALPEAASPSSWPEWAGDRDPIDAIFAAVRAALVVVDAYLLLVVGLAAAARVTRAIAAQRLLRLCLLPLRRGPLARRPVAQGLVRSLIGVSVAVTSTATPVAASTSGVRSAGSALSVTAGWLDDVTDEDVPLLRRLPASPTPTDRTTARTPPDAVARTLPPPLDRPWRPVAVESAPEEAAGQPPPANSPADPAGGAADEDTAAGAADGDEIARPAATTWTVRPGDHLWSIAESTLRARGARKMDERRVRSYWRKLIAVNRSRLADPDNPDLILPGQVFRLPPGGT